MKTETLTITTETANVLNQDFLITSFELKVTGFCDICGEQEAGNKSSLESAGWYLGSREHFCPSCN